MIPYSQFQLNAEQIDYIKRKNQIRSIAKYIREHGVEPDATTADSFFTVSNEQLERQRRLFYSVCQTKKGTPNSISGENTQPTSEENGGLKVLLFYDAGFNSLSTYVSEQIKSLKRGYVPEINSNNVLLVFSHLTEKNQDYTTETSPVLTRLYSDGNEIHEETLVTLSEGTSIANAETVTWVLNYIQEEFPNGNYGLVFSSHATGWLPEGYYNNAKKYEGIERGNTSWKSVGQEYYDEGSKTQEIEIQDLAGAIPYKLDYILFDACFMATVEVAWELKNKCRYFVASPCEVPANGFNYQTLTANLLQPKTPDLVSVCMEYYSMYANDNVYGATITMVDNDKLDTLATVCRTLFEKYSNAIRNLSGRNVQTYDRTMGKKLYYVFFDMKDMLREAGATETELNTLQLSLNQCIVYEEHTPRFINLKLNNCCGLSMYLPAYSDYTPDIYHGTEFLDNWYKNNISWNGATYLVDENRNRVLSTEK